MSDADLDMAKTKAELFQDDVARYVKRHRPEDLIPVLAGLADQATSNLQLMRQAPAHNVLHAMEANCAYHRTSFSDPVTSDRVRRLMNVYHNYNDPVTSYLLKDRERLDLFLILLARQQFLLQETDGGYDLGRGLLLFSENLFPTTVGLMQAELGFGFKDWTRFCFSLYAGLLRRNPPVIGPDYFLKGEGEVVSAKQLPGMFAMLSASPQEIGEQYRILRSKVGTLYDPYIPTYFARKPLIRLSPDRFVAAHKTLVLHQGSEGLFDICRSRWPETFNSKEFGPAFEGYVGQVLDCLLGAKVYAEKDMRQFTSDKMCDYIAVGEHYVLFVECKGVEYRAVLSSEDAIKGDNSTTKISTAVDQIFSAAQLACDGTLSRLLGDIRGKSLIASVVTYRHIYLVNGDHYWDEAIIPRLKTANGDTWGQWFQFRPQTLDISELEQLVTVSNGENVTPLDLYHEKLSQHEVHVGEWTTFLAKRRKEHHKLALLDGVFEKFTDEVVQRFSRSL